MANKHRAKGTAGEKEVVKELLEYFKEYLVEDDVRFQGSGNGEDILLSGIARKIMPMNIEVKRRKTFTMCRYMEQAVEHGKHRPCVMFREDGRGKKWLATIELDYLLELLKHNYES